MGLSCLYTNTDCLFNKTNELEPFLNINNIDIAAITETLPKNCTSNDFKNIHINFDGYTCLSNNVGRGVCLYIKDDYEIIERFTDVENIFSPSIYCKIKSKSNELFIIGVVYRSPNSSSLENDQLIKQIEKCFKNHSGERVVLVGDFNYPEINWSNESCNKPEGHPSSRFLNIVHTHFLTQFVDSPTHHRGLQTPTLIDLILSNDPHFITNTRAITRNVCDGSETIICV